MLLGSITILSAVAAVLWALLGGVGIPAAVGIFVGSCVGLLALAFLFLWAVTAVVKQEVPQEEDSKFYRWLTKLYIPAIFTILGMKIDLQGQELVPTEGRFLMVCNHLNILDPVLLLGCFPKAQLAFISKRENAEMFIIGNLMHKLMCQMINRENDREALKTIVKCIQILKEDKASIAVFPEGYTSRDGKLHTFRSGVFKIAQKANVPIVVCTIQNSQYVFRNAKHLKPTDVYLHLLTVIPAEEVQSSNTVELAERIHDMMAADLGE